MLQKKISKDIQNIQILKFFIVDFVYIFVLHLLNLAEFCFVSLNNYVQFIMQNRTAGFPSHILPITVFIIAMLSG